MGGVHFVGEAIGSEAAAEVVTPARGNVESSSNLLILDVFGACDYGPRWWSYLP